MDKKTTNASLLLQTARRRLAGRGTRAALLTLGLVVYGALYLSLHRQVGETADFLAAPLVVLSGWWFGWRWGVAAGLFISILDSALLDVTGAVPWTVSLRGPAELNLLAAVSLGFLVGRWSDQARALRRSEERHRFLVETARDVIFSLAPDGVFTTLNPAFEIFTGRPRAAWLGRSFADLIAPADQAAALDWFQRVRQGEALRAIRLRVPTQAGAELVVEVNLAPQFRQGQVVGVLGVARDMTQEQRAEDALRVQAARLRALAEATHEGLLFHTAGRITDVNPAAVQLWGAADAAALIGREVAECVAPAAQAAFQARLAAGAGGAFETLARRLDGATFPAEVTLRPAAPGAAPVMAWRDLTAPKLVEQALRDSQARLASVIDSALDAVISLDADQRVILFNPAAERLFRCSAAEVLGQSPERFIPLDIRARHSGYVQAFDREARANRMMDVAPALTCWRADGTEFLAEVSISQTSVAGQKIYTAFMRDVTERRQAEHKLAASEAKLRALFAAMRDVVLIIDDAGVYHEVAPTSPDWVYRSPHALAGQSLAQVFLPAQAAQILGVIQEVVREQAPRQIEYPLEVGEHRLWFSAKVTPLEKNLAVAVVRDITERKEAEETFRRRAEESAALSATARDLAAQHDLPTLLNTIVERVRGLLRCGGAGIYLYDPARGDLEMAWLVGLMVPVGTRLRLGEGMAGRVAQSRQPLIVDDYQTWSGRSAQYAAVPFRAVLQAPMLYAGELIGVVVANEVGASNRKFTEADAHLLALFGEYAAAAVHTEHLFSETRRRLTELEAVARVSAALRTAQTLTEMLPRFLDETLAVVGALVGNITLYDPARDELLPTVGRGWMARVGQSALRPDEGIAGHVFQSGEIRQIDEFVTDPHIRLSVNLTIPAGWSGVCLPIRTAHEVVGVMFVAVERPRQLIVQELTLLTTLTEIAGNAIHRTRLHEQTERNLQRLAALRAIDAMITSSLDLSMTLTVLLGHALTQLGAHAADILLLDAPTQTLRYGAGSGFRSAGLRQTRVALGSGLAGQAALERRLVAVADLHQYGTGFLRETLVAGEDFVAYFGMPLIAKGVVQGVLEVFHRAPLNPDAEWRSFLEALAGQAAIAIDSAGLFEGLQRSNAELAAAYDATIEGWARALELRDRETEGHTRRVTELSVRLARVMGVGEAELVHLRRGALLHDIGKMAVPDIILLKPGPLTDDEWVLMRQHPQHAYDMLAPIVFLRPALDIPYCHHEKWDGSGYPRGLRGEQIPLWARIFAVVDVWDALCSDRPYRSAWPEAQVAAYLVSLSGAHFDPAVVKAFQALLGQRPA